MYIHIHHVVIPRVNRKEQRYTGALCGLGFDKRINKPLHTDNDIEDQFEVEFGQEDLKEVCLFSVLIFNSNHVHT